MSNCGNCGNEFPKNDPDFMGLCNNCHYLTQGGSCRPTSRSEVEVEPADELIDILENE